MQVLKSTFKSSFVKKITKEQVDRLTKAIIIKCINCHGADVYKTGKKFDTDLTNALDKKGYHNKFTKELFKLAGIKFDNSDLIEKQDTVVIGMPTIEEVQGQEQKAGDNFIYSKADKRLSNGEISKLKKNGIDPHNLKPNSDYDLYKDKKGNIFIKLKNSKAQGEWTGYNINDF